VGLRPAAVAVVALSWAGFGPDVLSAQGDRAEYRRAVPTDRSDFTRTKEEGFPLNVNPKIVAAAEAQLADDDLVMGVVVGGEARAYPVNYMNGPHNEVVNDQLGGLPIAPTW
jgi:hypothetical protein